jgi:hypothetical protein
MMELFHAGIPIQEELAKRFNLTTFQMNKLIQEGRVGFRDVYQALIGLTTGTGAWATANEKNASTLAGTWKGVLDIIDDLKLSIGRDLAPVVKEVLQDFKNWLDLNKGHLAQDFMDFLNGVAYAIGFILGFITEMLRKLGLLPDSSKSKEVSAAPGAGEVRMKSPLGKFLQTGQLQAPPPPLTHAQMTAAAQADRSRLEAAAKSFNSTLNVYVTAPPGSQASQLEYLKKVATEVFGEEHKKVIRQGATPFAEGTQ